MQRSMGFIKYCRHSTKQSTNYSTWTRILQISRQHKRVYGCSMGQPIENSKCTRSKSMMCTSCKVLQTFLQSLTLFFWIFSTITRAARSQRRIAYQQEFSHACNDILKIAYQQEFSVNLRLLASHACSDILKKSLSNVNQVRLHNQYYCFHETEDPTTEGVSRDPIQSHSLYSKLSRLPTTSYYTKSQHEISQTSTDLHLWGA